MADRITNTAAHDPVFTPAGIEAQEARGQQEVVNSDQLPTKTLYCSDADFEALGFTFGPPDPADPLFRPATLPEGWTRQGSDHAMWSSIMDERGIERVAVFYKAAFYDRKAHMRLSNVGDGEAHRALHGEDAPMIPWDLLTDSERRDARAGLDDMANRIAEHPDIYGECADRLAALLATAPEPE